MKIHGHPRSGCNLALKFVAEAFYPEIAKQERTAQTGHWSRRQETVTKAFPLFGGHAFWKEQRNRVYILRDGRDVALSLYRTKIFQHSSWEALSFSGFLRKPLDWHWTPGRRADSTLTIVEHWKKHLDSWRARDRICYIRYEEMLTEPNAVVRRLATFLSKAPKKRSFTVEPVGPSPSGNHRVGKWKDHYSDANLTHFHSIVPKDYWGLA